MAGRQDFRTKEQGASAVAITVMAAVTTTANNRNNNDNHFARTGSMQIYGSKDPRRRMRIRGSADVRLYDCAELPGQRKKPWP